MADQITAIYYEGGELSDLWLSWRRPNKGLVPFTTEPHDFSMKVAAEATPITTIFTKTDGFTGADSDPNLIVQWAPGEIGDLDPGIYVGTIVGLRVSDSRPRDFPVRFEIRQRAGG